jgi:multidrug transporter EmrE-like cation transporter
MPVSAYGFILVMAACLFGHSFLNTLAANELSAAELYPLSQGAALILSTAMASVFFGEKIKPRLIIGIVLAFAGLLVMNLLSF